MPARSLKICAKLRYAAPSGCLPTAAALLLPAAARCCLRQQSVAVHCNFSPPARLPYPFLSSASRVITQFLLTHRFAALCDGTFDTDRTFGVFCKLCTTRKNIRKKITNYYNEKHIALIVLFRYCSRFQYQREQLLN